MSIQLTDHKASFGAPADGMISVGMVSKMWHSIQDSSNVFRELYYYF